MSMRRAAMRAAIVLGAIVCVAGCVTTTEETIDNPPPYASVTGDVSDPSSAPKPPPDPDQEGVLATTTDALGTVVTFPFRLIGSAFKGNEQTPPPY